MAVAIRRLFGLTNDAVPGGSDYDALTAGAVPDASEFWPVTGGNADKNIEQTQRNDEVRGRRAGTSPRPFRASPVLTVPVPGYLPLMKKAFAKVFGGTVPAPVGSAAEGFTHAFPILGFGATNLPAIHTQLVRDDHNDKLAGCVYNRLSMTFPLDGAATSEHELWAKYITHDTSAPPTPSGYPSEVVEPLMLRDARIWQDGADEVQTITVGAGVTTYTLTFDGQTTAAITHPATAATVQTELVALNNIGPNDVQVTGDSGGPYTVTFKGGLGNRNVSQLTATGTGGTVTTATSTQGGTSLPNLQGFEFAFVNNLSRKWYAMRNRVAQQLGNPARDHLLWFPAENKLGPSQDVTFAINFGDVDTAADLAHDFRQIRKYVFECYGAVIPGTVPLRNEVLRITIYNGVFQSGGPEALSARDDLTARYEGNAFHSEADGADVKVEVLDGVSTATT